jgi:hypothetical protein
MKELIVRDPRPGITDNLLLKSKADLNGDLVLNAASVNASSLLLHLEPLHIAERLLSALYGTPHGIIKAHFRGSYQFRFPIDFGFVS